MLEQTPKRRYEEPSEINTPNDRGFKVPTYRYPAIHSTLNRIKLNHGVSICSAILRILAVVCEEIDREGWPQWYANSEQKKSYGDVDPDTLEMGGFEKP